MRGGFGHGFAGIKFWAYEFRGAAGQQAQHKRHLYDRIPNQLAFIPCLQEIGLMKLGHTLNIRRLLLFVCLAFLFVMTSPLHSQEQDNPQATPQAPTIFQVMDSVNIHPGITMDNGISFLPVLLFNKTYITPQYRLGFSLRLFHYLDDAFYLGYGFNFRYATDTSSTKIIIRPGSTGGSIDLAFGYFPKPAPDSVFSPGMDIRFGASYNAINETQLYFAYLYATARPFARLFHRSIEIGVPCSINFRRDPAAAFDIGLEVSFVL